MAEKNQSPEHRPSPFTSLPHKIIVDIVARVPRWDYPTISLVSKSFRSLVASPELYAKRSLLGCTEHSLYVVLYDSDTDEEDLCLCCPLCRKVNRNRLVTTPPLPLMPSRARYVTVGSKIYVLPCLSEESTLSIDCRSHTVQPISDIPQASFKNTVAGIIDEKIYVIGRCPCDEEVSSGREWCTMVLDTKSQTWELEIIKPDMELGDIRGGDNVVMEDKIYMRDSKNSFVYAPKENKWETEETLNSERWEGACVINNVLYYYDICKKKLRAYDPKQRCWRVVNGLEELSLKTRRSCGPTTVSYGGKLALFYRKYDEDWYRTKEIWYAEIALERRQGGEIWGKVQWCDVVLDDGRLCMFNCLAVTF